MAAAPRPSLSSPVSCRYTGHRSRRSRRPTGTPFGASQLLADCDSLFLGCVAQKLEEHAVLECHVLTQRALKLLDELIESAALRLDRRELVEHFMPVFFLPATLVGDL